MNTKSNDYRVNINSQIQYHACPHCRGLGRVAYAAERYKDCGFCEGAAELPVDPEAILLAITDRDGYIVHHPTEKTHATYGALYVWFALRSLRDGITVHEEFMRESIGLRKGNEQYVDEVQRSLNRIASAAANTIWIKTPAKGKS